MRATLNLHKTKRICKYQQQIDETDNYKNQGTIIRSKEKIVLNEEKPTKYFFSQEKQKQNKKHITCLKNDTGKLLKKKFWNIERVYKILPNFIHKTKYMANNAK